jgi:hypothetical protein
VLVVEPGELLEAGPEGAVAVGECPRLDEPRELRHQQLPLARDGDERLVEVRQHRGVAGLGHVDVARDVVPRRLRQQVVSHLVEVRGGDDAVVVVENEVVTGRIR